MNAGAATARHEYFDGPVRCLATVALPQAPQVFGANPCVIIAHAYSGKGEAERALAERFASLGYVGFALDMYGEGRTGNNAAESAAMMNELDADRTVLQRRISAGVEAAKSLPQVDPARIVAVGFCFGGKCVLDLARTGRDDVAGVVCVHGLFDRPPGSRIAPIKAKVLALHGYSDPLAPPAAMAALGDELTEAGADWRMHVYGHALHAFTSPKANNPKAGVAYHESAARQALAAMDEFLHELFKGSPR